MALTLSSGNLTEDFNYGNPYTAPISPSEPYIDYSTFVGAPQPRYNPGSIFNQYYASTKQYVDSSNGYRRSQYRLQNPSLAGWTDTQAKNAPTSSGYYLKWPVMRDDDSEVASMVINTGAGGGSVTFYTSFSGQSNDVVGFYNTNYLGSVTALQVITNKASWAWSEHTFALQEGYNKIAWALITGAYYIGRIVNNGAYYFNPILRSSAYNVLQFTPPRSFRLGPISATNVTALPTFTSAWVGMVGTGSLTPAPGPVKRTGKAKLSANAVTVYKTKLGSGYLPAGATVTAAASVSVARAQCAMQSAATVTATGAVSLVSIAWDGGMVIESHAKLAVLVPEDTVQTVYALRRSLYSTVVQMPTPAFKLGRPYVPAFPGPTATVVSTNGGYSYADAVLPSSTAHVLPNPGKYRWRATDIASADGTQVTAWNEHSGLGPAFVSGDLFAPTITSVEHYYAGRDITVSYSRVLSFDWRYAQFMQMSLVGADRETAANPYVFQFVAIINGIPTRTQYQHIFDIGTLLPNASVGSNNRQTILSGGSIDARSEYPADGARARFFASPAKIMMQGTEIGATTESTAPMPTVPVVITLTLNNFNNAGFQVRGHNIALIGRGNMGSAIANDWVLGRTSGAIGHIYGSSMQVMEMNYFDRALSDTEIIQNSNWLAGVYQFALYR